MRGIDRRTLAGLAATAAASAAATPGPAAAQGGDPLPSWREGPRRRALLDFVAAVTTPGGGDFVPPPARVAVFDNDGTLWLEQPAYTQLFFVLDRIRALAPQNPRWREDPLFRAAAEGDVRGAAAGGVEGLLRLAGAALAGNTPEASQRAAAEWLAAARDARWGRPHTELVYQPMLEVLAFLEARGFANFVVAGGGVEFVRAFAEGDLRHPPAPRRRLDLRAGDGRGGGARRAHAPAAGGLRGRRAGQAGRDRPAHRPPPHRRLRQFRRRLAHAALHDRGAGAAARHDPPPRRPRARTRLRPGKPCGPLGARWTTPRRAGGR